MSTTFRSILQQEDVASIEIPIIQRDYAQGRTDPSTSRIRRNFLTALHGALTGKAEPVRLDFIYGEIENGHLVPLDGQQRLTTLFLLHWYLAVRCALTEKECDFLTRFTYKTRFSAKHFCETLVTQRPPIDVNSSAWNPLQHALSAWITDQSWYAGAWRHDPTIQGMLVTLDSIHDLFADTDQTGCHQAWANLVSETAPSITFDYLPIEDIGPADQQYIKMNSRGKPLTEFEHLKANFEKMLAETSKAARDEFVTKIDLDWSDLLWPLRDSGSINSSDNAIIDDEFLRLLHFIGEIFSLRQGLNIAPKLFDEDVDSWAKAIYGSMNAASCGEAQRDLFDTLDSLYQEFGAMTDAQQITDWFSQWFSQTGYRPGAVAIFGKTDLFASCCTDYGKMIGEKVRAYPLSRSLLFFAVLEYLRQKPRLEPTIFSERIRTLRNLIFASDNEIRLEKFKEFLTEIAKFLTSSTTNLDLLSEFNSRQIEEEKQKASYLKAHPENKTLEEAMHRLEDHGLLRGTLAAFALDCDPSVFIRRAETFIRIFPLDGSLPPSETDAALLVQGDYSRKITDGRFLFASQEQPAVWRELLTAPRSDFAQIREPLMKLLDRVAGFSNGTIDERLEAITNSYLRQQEQLKQLDWRYYLIKYPIMRSGACGLYISSSGHMGFDLCMMRARPLNSNFRDPYLLAVIDEADAVEGTDIANNWHTGWTGYTPEGRWIRPLRSGEDVIRCTDYGFQLSPPSSPVELTHFDKVCKKYSVGSDLMLKPQQTAAGSIPFDGEDRIELGARFLKDLLSAPH